jgi:hypothetical protein
MQVIIKIQFNKLNPNIMKELRKEVMRLQAELIVLDNNGKQLEKAQKSCDRALQHYKSALNSFKRATSISLI